MIIYSTQILPFSFTPVLDNIELLLLRGNYKCTIMLGNVRIVVQMLRVWVLYVNVKNVVELIVEVVWVMDMGVVVLCVEGMS
jgi:hypothetical protein